MTLQVRVFRYRTQDSDWSENNSLGRWYMSRWLSVGIFSVAAVNSFVTSLEYLRTNKRKSQAPEKRQNLGNCYLDIFIWYQSIRKLKTHVRRKTTHTDRILNSMSNNSRTHKRGSTATLFKHGKTNFGMNQLEKAEGKHILGTSYQKNFIQRYIDLNRTGKTQ